MSEENKTITTSVRTRTIVIMLMVVTVAAIAFSIHANIRRTDAERRIELVEKLNTLQLDSCSVRNEDLTNHLQELMYTLEYEKKKNQNN